MTITIKTNNIPRPLLTLRELPAKAQKDFDDECFEDDVFFEYKGVWHPLGDYMHIGPEVEGLRGWDGYSNDSFFSGTVVRFVSDGDEVIVGTYFS